MGQRPRALLRSNTNGNNRFIVAVRSRGGFATVARLKACPDVKSLVETRRAGIEQRSFVAALLWMTAKDGCALREGACSKQRNSSTRRWPLQRQRRRQR